MNTTWQHTTVLLNEAIEALLGMTDHPTTVLAGATFVDATFGRGGHSRLMLSKLPPTARLIAFDKDLEAVAAAAAISDARFSIRHDGFKEIAQLPAASVAGLLMDLGISSPQIDTPERGFSFRYDAPDRKSTRLNSSHVVTSRMPSSA